MSGSNRLVVSTLALVALIAALFVGLVGLYFFEGPYLTYPVQPFPLVKNSVKPGQIVPLHVVRCSTASKRKTYTMSRALIDEESGVPLVLPELTTYIDPGCNEAIAVSHRLPEVVPAGRYRLIGLVAVHGTLRTHHVEWRSEPFTVEAP